MPTMKVTFLKIQKLVKTLKKINRDLHSDLEQAKDENETLRQSVTQQDSARLSNESKHSEEMLAILAELKAIKGAVTPRAG